MLERRQSLLSVTPRTPTGSAATTPTKGNAPPLTPTSTPKTPRSVYREILYLTLVSLGQDNIDLTAFDREYRRAYEKLPAKYDTYVHQCDKPPTLQALTCRKFFRELKL